MTVIYDVAVIGLGGHGSAAVAHLAERGSKLLGIEKFHRAHANGSSHGRSRIIRLAYYEDPRYVPLLRRSLALWKALNERLLSPAFNDEFQEGKEALLKMTGGLMIGLPNSEVILGTIASIKEQNLTHEVLTAAEIKIRFPAFHVSDGEIGIFENDAGYLVPEACVDAHLKVAEQKGADLRFNESVVSWCDVTASDTDESTANNDDSRTASTSNQRSNGFNTETDNSGGLYKITTTHGAGQTSTYFSRKIILSVGPWAPELYGKDLYVPLHAERRVQFWFKPLNHLPFQNIPVYIWDADTDGSFYGFPAQNGDSEGVKIAMHFKESTNGVNDTICTPDTISRIVTEKEINEMRAVIARRLPQLNGEILELKTCMYTMTEDHHFLIDFHPSHGKDVIVLSPCSGHGFKFCTVIGEIAADLAINGFTAYDISLFRIQSRKSEE